MYQLVTNLYLKGQISIDEAAEMFKYLIDLQIKCCVNCDKDIETCEKLGKFKCDKLMEEMI